MAPSRMLLVAAFILALSASRAFAAQSWPGAQVMPKSPDVQLQSDDGSPVSIYDIGWPAAVQKTKGRYLWIQDDGGYSRNQAGGWIYSDDVVKLDSARDHYSDELRRDENPWLYWMRGISWEAHGEPGIAILDYQNALANDPQTRLDDLHIRLGRLLAQQQLAGGRGIYSRELRKQWYDQFEAAKAINPHRPQLWYEWAIALSQACACTQHHPSSEDRANSSGDKTDIREAAVGPTPAGSDAAVQALKYFDYAQQLSGRWWRVPLARAELMLAQCDEESDAGERVAIRYTKPEFFNQLLVGCNRQPVIADNDLNSEVASRGGEESKADAGATAKSVAAPEPLSPHTIAVLAAALDDFNRTISLNPSVPDAYRDRAEVYRLVHRLAEGQESATMACQLCNYRQVGSLRTLAQIDHDMKLYESASDYALRAAELAAGDEQQRYLKLWHKCSDKCSGDAKKLAVASAQAGYVASRGEEESTESSPEKLKPAHIEPPPGFMSRSGSAVPD